MIMLASFSGLAGKCLTRGYHIRLLGTAVYHLNSGINFIFYGANSFLYTSFDCVQLCYIANSFGILPIYPERTLSRDRRRRLEFIFDTLAAPDDTRHLICFPRR